MKSPKFILLWICLVALNGCGGTIFPFQKAAPSVTDQQDFSRQIEIPANVKILEFHHRGGKIAIVSWEKPYILIEGVTRASAETVELARSTIELVQVVAYEQPQNRLVLDYEAPSDFARGKKLDEGIDYTAHVPRSMMVDLKVENGSASVSNMDYDVFIEHQGGDIQVDSIRGNATIHCSGREGMSDRAILKSIGRNLSLVSRDMNVEIEQVSGDIHVDHKYGEMRISDAGGKLTFQGSNSPVELARIKGYLEISNSVGDVICEGFYDGINADVRDGTLKLNPQIPVARGYQCKIVKGNLIFRVPDQSNMLVELMAVNGSIQSDFPLPVSAEGKVSYAKGAIGQGAPVVHMEVDRGNISMLRAITVPGSSAVPTSAVPPETNAIGNDPVPVTGLKSVEIK